MLLRLRAVALRPQPGAVRALSKSALVTLEKHQRVGILRLNDPKRLNPMTSAMGIALEAKVAEINSRADEFSAVVLTGAGRAFSAGGDLKFLQERTVDTVTRNTVGMQVYYSRYMSLRSLKMPLVAALNGPAIGAGLCISLFADVRVAAKDAKLGFTSVNTGLHPGMASTHFLPLIVGVETANHLLLTGKVINGTEAERLRLVSKAVENEDILAEAVAIAEEMAIASSTAVRAVLRTLRSKQEEGLAAALMREADAQAHSYTTKDFQEGLDALAAKRGPVFEPPERYSN